LSRQHKAINSSKGDENNSIQFVPIGHCSRKRSKNESAFWSIFTTDLDLSNSLIAVEVHKVKTPFIFTKTELFSSAFRLEFRGH
jgi:hypothetical protein